MPVININRFHFKKNAKNVYRYLDVIRRRNTDKVLIKTAMMAFISVEFPVVSVITSINQTIDVYLLIGRNILDEIYFIICAPKAC
jgi:hypothetical protein